MPSQTSRSWRRRIRPSAGSRAARIAAGIAALLTLAAAATPPSDSVAPPAARAQAPGFDLELAGGREPGRRLVLEGQARDGRGPLPGFLLRVYQADARGRYGIPGPEEDVPRLAGFLKTGPSGQFRIRTILPGSYGGPPHLHFEFRDSLGAIRMTFVNLFPPDSGDYSSYPPDFFRKFRSAPYPDEPRDVAVRPDSLGVFRVRWDVDTRRSTPFREFPDSWKDAPK